jgi:predicted metal-dependent enzyme (double-stranded beta helix superfamily)
MLPIANLESLPAPADALRGLVHTCDTLDAAFFAGARKAVSALLVDASLLNDMAPADPTKVSRTLAWCDPMNRFGIWVLWWPPGSATPIHNHHCSCAFGVYRGRIEEVLYRIDDNNGGRVTECERYIRTPGYVGGGSLDSKVIHRMSNPDDGLAASVHLYAYHPHQHVNSIAQSFLESADLAS